MRVNPSLVLQSRGGVAQGVGDVLGFDRIPLAVRRIVLHVNGRGRCSPGTLKVERKAAKGFCGAIERVSAGLVANLFTSDGVLLVGEGERRILDALHPVVIQRGHGSVDNLVVNGKVDVLIAADLATRFRITMDIFGGSEQPVESDNDEVNDVTIEGETTWSVLRAPRSPQMMVMLTG